MSKRPDEQPRVRPERTNPDTAAAGPADADPAEAADGLTTPQAKAVEAMLVEPTLTRAAAVAGVSELTLRRWLQTGPFRTAVLAARREAFGQAIGLTQRYAPVAVATLVKVMQDVTGGPGATDPITRHYQALTAPERFVLLVEAMARRDEREADRLQDTCPLVCCRMEDAEFRDRVRRAHVITATVCLNMREGLAQIRMASAFRELSDQFATPVVRLAEVALLYGRAYGHWEAGAVEEVGVPDTQALVAEVAANPYLGEQLGGLRAGVGEAMQRVADEVLGVVGIAHAADLLAQWEGFGRFCRDELGVEPLVLTAAFGLGRGDPAAEVRAAFPGAQPAAQQVYQVTADWSRSWARRFGP